MQNSDDEKRTQNNTGDRLTTQTGMVSTRDPRNNSTFTDNEIKSDAEGIEEEHEVRQDHTPKARLDMQDNEATGNELMDEGLAPHIKGEQRLGGTDPDPAEDDDTLEAEHQVGLRPHDTSENKEELDVASDFDEAEEYQKTH